MSTSFVDSHCHLDDERFEHDRDETIGRAREAGLKYMLAIGTGNGPPDLEAALRLADRHSFIYATVGVHPNDAPKLPESSAGGEATFDNLRSLLQHPKVVAVGEIGLDYHWGVPKDVQRSVFERQLAMAEEAQMPIVIHTRDAWDDTVSILRERWAPTGLPCVMHCFTGNRQQANDCLSLGFTLAFGGVVTYPKSGDIREAAAHTPIERLLLETDAPYLAPVPYRGKRNEPAYVTLTAETIAAICQASIEEIGSASVANFESIFLRRRESAGGLH